ncbi:MAG TPA: hypothetical protein VG099_07350 [Gemmataceae bacterium]|nr:hypothetical protein [Gemmataceae bacterium]
MFETATKNSEALPCGVSERVQQVRRFVAGFRPSTAGFHFANAFVHQSLFRIPVLGSSVPIGDAARGLCGGMIFAARDYFEAGLAPPVETAPPQLGEPLFGYLVRRLFDSWNLPGGPLKYYAWMSVPEKGGRHLLWKARFEEWPRIKAGLDRNRPVPLGLVRVASRNPWQLGFNHQVLAYGYELSQPARNGGGTRFQSCPPSNEQLTIYVYDPNHPRRDDVTITLDGSAAEACGGLHYSTGEPLRGFFRTRYTFCQPAMK